MMKCLNCGKSGYAEDMVFCSVCGSRLVEEVQEPEEDKQPDLTQQIKELKEKNDELETLMKRKDDEIEKIRQQTESLSRGRLVGWVVAVIFMLASISLFAVYKNESDDASYYRRQYSSALSEQRNLRDKTDELQEQLQEKERAAEELQEQVKNVSECFGPVGVKVNKVYNAMKGGKIINDGALLAADMRYLYYDFTVYFFDDSISTAEIYIDIYRPDGTLDRNTSSSPAGHTTSLKVTNSGNAVIGSNGWGNAEQSLYTAGTYRIDFVYDSKVICSSKVVVK